MNYLQHVVKTASWIALTLCLWPLGTSAEHSVGKPGDPLRLLVSEARDDANVILIRVKPETLQAATDVKDWYAQNYEAYQSTMRAAELKWIETDAAACARAFSDTHQIVFSYSTCRKALDPVSNPQATQRLASKADAVKLLLHENSHLLGKDEDFADALALAIYRTWLTLDINRTPRWDDISPDRRPSERTAHASAVIHTSHFSGVFVWGGCNEIPREGQIRTGVACSSFLGDGGIYNKTKDTWTTVPAVPKELFNDPLESIRAYATAIHVPGTDPQKNGEIYLFGGCSGARFTCEKDYNSVLVFNLETLTWSVLTTEFTPPARSKHHAFLTDDGMLIWGGVANPLTAGRGTSLNDGWILNKETHRWRAFKNDNAPSPRRYSAAVFTGSANTDASLNRKLIVYGGCDREIGEDCPTYLKDGAVYDLGTNSWTKLPDVSLAARAHSGAVWTGQQMLILGGWNGAQALADGAILTLAADAASSRWSIFGDLSSEPRYGHTLIWTGDRALIWGGLSGYNKFISSLSEYYLPTAQSPRGSWRRLELTAAPVSRTGNTAFWLDDGLFVWGGLSEDRAYLQTGGIFLPHLVPN